MAKRKDTLLLTLLTLCYKTGGQFNFDINDKYYNDEEVIDCKLTLYLLLLTKEGEEQDKKFKEFEEKYNNLTKEKQEYIREDLKKIFEEQDKNRKEKEKKI
jgi:hypothetical protein